jgi:hypothetical protein
VNSRYVFFYLLLSALTGAGCAPIEYSVVIVQAAQAISQAEVSGAACTEPQINALSPVTRNNNLQSGTELASTEKKPVKDDALSGTPMCNAPYEYYSAIEYLEKAREEVGYSDYEAAVEYARSSRDFAQKAWDISQNMDKERGR